MVRRSLLILLVSNSEQHTRGNTDPKSLRLYIKAENRNDSEFDPKVNKKSENKKYATHFYV